MVQEQGSATSERQKVIDEIVAIAEDNLASCRMGTIDSMAWRYCGLLDDLGAKKEGKRVYAFYQALF